MKLNIYNSLSKKTEVFKPIKPNEVGLYSCGPTVYVRAHIGNLRAFIFADILKRTLLSLGYSVKHVMNITDVGHLVGDGDYGEDKVEAAAKKEKLKAQDITRDMTERFFNDIKLLNIKKDDMFFPRASEYIKEQTELILRLEKNNFTYKTSDGIYFDTTKYPEYGNLGNINVDGLKAGARVDMGEKRSATDFALWKLSSKEEERQQEWDSPWGIGYPGWHLECSAMSMSLLGEHFDIHTGGVDHIAVHHNNEIAQSQCATNIKYVNYWMHNEFLNIKDEKMAKSSGTTYNLDNLIGQGYSPLDFRYLVLQTLYRNPISFSFESLKQAKNSRANLSYLIAKKSVAQSSKNETDCQNILSPIYSDLNTPQLLANLWNLVRENDTLSESDIICIDKIDAILGLNLSTEKPEEDVLKLLDERNTYRNAKDYTAADNIRELIRQKGYEIEDGKENSFIVKIYNSK